MRWLNSRLGTSQGNSSALRERLPIHGDACQPLKIPYLHDGDPKRTVEHVITRGKNKGKVEERRFGEGVHGGYEDLMISAFRKDVLNGLKQTPRRRKKS